jgi:hypothetical protein
MVIAAMEQMTVMENPSRSFMPMAKPSTSAAEAAETVGKMLP